MRDSSPLPLLMCSEVSSHDNQHHGRRVTLIELISPNAVSLAARFSAEERARFSEFGRAVEDHDHFTIFVGEAVLSSHHALTAARQFQASKVQTGRNLWGSPAVFINDGT